MASRYSVDGYTNDGLESAQLLSESIGGLPRVVFTSTAVLIVAVASYAMWVSCNTSLGLVDDVLPAVMYGSGYWEHIARNLKESTFSGQAMLRGVWTTEVFQATAWRFSGGGVSGVHALCFLLRIVCFVLAVRVAKQILPGVHYLMVAPVIGAYSFMHPIVPEARTHGSDSLEAMFTLSLVLWTIRQIKARPNQASSAECLFGIVLAFFLVGSKESAVGALVVAIMAVAGCSRIRTSHRVVFVACGIALTVKRWVFLFAVNRGSAEEPTVSRQLSDEIVQKLVSSSYATKQAFASKGFEDVLSHLLLAESLRIWLFAIVCLFIGIGVFKVIMLAVAEGCNIRPNNYLFVTLVFVVLLRAVGPDSDRHMESPVWLTSVVMGVGCHVVFRACKLGAHLVALFSLLLVLANTPSFLFQFTSQQLARDVDRRVLRYIEQVVATERCKVVVAGGNLSIPYFDYVRLRENPLMLALYFEEYLPIYEGRPAIKIRDYTYTTAPSTAHCVVALSPPEELVALGGWLVNARLSDSFSPRSTPERHVVELLRRWTIRLRLTNGREFYYIDAGSPRDMYSYTWYVYSFVPRN